jgi:hypothetical protein
VHIIEAVKVLKINRRPHTIHKKVTLSVEEAIIILRNSFSWGTQRIKENLRSPPYIRHLLETALGKPWVEMNLSRQRINEILKKHNRNGHPPGGRREWKRFRADHPDHFLWKARNDLHW